MNINSFVKYLNKTKDFHIDGSYYSYIEEWKQWWMGHYPKFHDVKETTSEGPTVTRTIASLRMPKHVCEDWASLLLNDKTTLTLGDSATSDWLLGKADEQTGGVLRDLKFWPNANRLVELAMRSGTGAFVLSLEGMNRDGEAVIVTPDARICLDYDPAECILPISNRHGVMTEVAFASEVTVNGNSCIYLQSHRLVTVGEVRQYRITNEYFTGDKEDSDSAAYTAAPLPDGVVAAFTTGSAIPWFAIITPNVVKNIRGGQGLGMAVFSEALDAAQQVDLAFDNYRQDIYLGGKKVFYSKRIAGTVYDADGNPRTVTPDAQRRQTFYQLPDSVNDPDAPPEWHEYNPALRVDDNSKAVQDALDYFSFKTGLGTHHYQFNAGNIATATQYTGERQDMVQHANRHQINIEDALIQIVRAILYAGKTIIGAPVKPDTSIVVNFDDSYITDSETRRAQQKDDALSGFLPKYRYVQQWYGLSEEDAKKAVQEAATEGTAADGITFTG